MEEAGDVINQRQAILSPCLYIAVKKNEVKIEDFSCLLLFQQLIITLLLNAALPCESALLAWGTERGVALWVPVFSFGFAGFCNYQDTGGKIWSIHFV